MVKYHFITKKNIIPPLPISPLIHEYMNVSFVKLVGVIIMTWTDRHNPRHVQYYAFGSGEKECNIMDIHVISTKDMGNLKCREKMVGGECVQDCHSECVGKSPIT